MVWGFSSVALSWHFMLKGTTRSSDLYPIPAECGEGPATLTLALGTGGPFLSKARPEERNAWRTAGSCLRCHLSCLPTRFSDLLLTPLPTLMPACPCPSQFAMVYLTLFSEFRKDSIRSICHRAGEREFLMELCCHQTGYPENPPSRSVHGTCCPVLSNAVLLSRTSFQKA